MTLEDYQSQIETAVRENNSAHVRLLAGILKESDDAKQELRRKGYGVTGTGLLETAQEVPWAVFEL